MPFHPGEVIARRYHKRHIVTWVQAVVVVADDDAGLLLWQPPGAEFAVYRDRAGRGIADVPIDQLTDASLVRTTWQHYGALILHPPNAASYSIWWFFAGDRFDGWYVNLEAPYVRHAAGIDTTDHALDLKVDPQRRVSWKDEDEFAARTGNPWYWDEAQALQIRATGERVAALADAGAYPFDGTYRDFRPDPEWDLPKLPAGWDGPVRTMAA